MRGWRRRPTARVLPIDPDGRVLLLRTWPHGGREPDWWYCVGGGVDPGETHEEAALRELFEETGCTTATLGTCLYTRDRPVPARQRVFAERVFLARTPAFTAVPTAPDDAERRVHFRFHWWSPAAIATTTDRFDPPELRTHLARWLAEPPAVPVVLTPVEPR